MSLLPMAAYGFSRIFKQVENLKHKSILYLIYAGGLRISELTAQRYFVG